MHARNLEHRYDYIGRDTILAFLSNEEIAEVARTQSESTLAPGEEYLDLDRLDEGIRFASSSRPIPMKRVLPKKSVRRMTWQKIMTQLAPPRGLAGLRAAENPSAFGATMQRDHS